MFHNHITTVNISVICTDLFLTSFNRNREDKQKEKGKKSVNPVVINEWIARRRRRRRKTVWDDMLF